jgi:hypothetical protein
MDISMTPTATQATYQCLKSNCGHTWSSPIQRLCADMKVRYMHDPNCPACNSKYFKWTNYETDFSS